MPTRRVTPHGIVPLVLYVGFYYVTVRYGSRIIVSACRFSVNVTSWVMLWVYGVYTLPIHKFG